MTTSTLALNHGRPVQQYFQNLGVAARQLGAALIAAPQPGADAGLATAKVLYRGGAIGKAEAADELQSLASQFEATQPNQAAELRWLASRA